METDFGTAARQGIGKLRDPQGQDFVTCTKGGNFTQAPIRTRCVGDPPLVREPVVSLAEHDACIA